MKLLTETEIEELDNFLLDRLQEEDTKSGKDEGIFEIAGLDGFLTAIVSGPVALPLSQWLDAVWGDSPPVFENEQAVTHIFNLMTRHMNGIAHDLMECPEDFQPLFYEREVDGTHHLVVDEWCEGYMRGVGLTPKWKDGGQAMETLLAPIHAFTEVGNWSGHDNPAKTPVIQQAIIANAREIHAFWLARRDHYEPHSATTTPQAKVGRNDPCPCDSGKKYKRCCLQ